jgi:hypothetical protein
MSTSLQGRFLAELCRGQPASRLIEIGPCPRSRFAIFQIRLAFVCAMVRVVPSGQLLHGKVTPSPDPTGDPEQALHLRVGRKEG